MRVIIAGLVLAVLTLGTMAAVPFQYRLIAMVPVFAVWCIAARCVEDALR